MNPVAEKLTGWESLRATRPSGGPHLPSLRRRQRPTAVENPAVSALREEQVVLLREDSILLRADGTPLAIDDSGAPIRNGKGEITGAVIIFRDVTEARRAAMELRQYQSHLETLVRERTAEIMDTNKRLVAEIEERKRAEAALAYRAELEALVSSISADFLALSATEGGRQFEVALGTRRRDARVPTRCASTSLRRTKAASFAANRSGRRKAVTDASREGRFSAIAVPGPPRSVERQPMFHGTW